jgi:predicted RNA polymerase sigma factor
MAIAKRCAVDAFRRDTVRERKHQEIARTLDDTRDAAAEAIEAAMVWTMISATSWPPT